MSELILVLLVSVISAILLSLVLRWRRPHWTRFLTSLVAAAMVPGITIALCAFVFVNAATASRESCGVDACGMAMMAAMVVSGWAVIGFLVGWASAFAVQALWPRR